MLKVDPFFFLSESYADCDFESGVLEVLKVEPFFFLSESYADCDFEFGVLKMLKVESFFSLSESYADCDVESGVLEVFKVEPPKCIELTGDEVRIVMSFQKEFNRIGNLS